MKSECMLLQDMPTATPEIGANCMVFSDKPEFIVLRNGAGEVECAIYPPRLFGSGKSAGMVLHLYGHGGSSMEYNMMRAPYAELRCLLRERGYWLVVPNLGGNHWMNDIACHTLDVVIEDMIKTRNVNPARVHILGTSMGGGSGLVYMMRRPNRIRSICAIFPMTDFAQWVQESPIYLQRIAEAHGVKPSEAVSVLQNLSPLDRTASFADTPVFLIHGDADSIVPVHHSRDFAATLKKQGVPVTYHEASGVGHVDEIVEPFQQEIVEFLTNLTLCQ